MIQPLEQFALKGETIAFMTGWINHFFQSKHITSDAPISYPINSTKATFAEHLFDDVTFAYHFSTGEIDLYFTHPHFTSF